MMRRKKPCLWGLSPVATRSEEPPTVAEMEWSARSLMMRARVTSRGEEDRLRDVAGRVEG